MGRGWKGLHLAAASQLARAARPRRNHRPARPAPPRRPRQRLRPYPRVLLRRMSARFKDYDKVG